MPIIPAKCTNCGASLEVDNTKDAAICPYCGSAFIVEKAINNYNTTNHISADTVNIYGGNGADFVIRAGTLEKYNGASTEVVIPDSVTSIGANAFKGCTGLASVTIPNSVTSIEGRVFDGCASLTSITIPNSMTSIGSYAFYGCTGLTSITIPNSVTSIESSAFCGCTGLTSITIPNSVTSIGGWAFEGCASLTSIIIPNSMTSIGDKAFCGCTGLTSVTIPNSVTSIGPSAFYGCTGLTSVTIPDSVTSIGSYAFYGCTRLTSITIPDSVTSIERNTFLKCTQLATVNASEEWKRTHWDVIRFLASCKPPEQSKSGCYIATAVYGSYDCPQVWTLRRFRDDSLAETWYGRTFIRIYYAVGPTLVKWFGHCAWFRKMWRGRLDRMVADLNANGVESTPYNDKNW